MSWEIPQIPAAGIFPSIDQIELFSEHLKKSIDNVEVENKRQETEDDDFLSEIFDSNVNEAGESKVENSAAPSPTAMSSSALSEPLPSSSSLSTKILPSALSVNIKYDNIR